MIEVTAKVQRKTRGAMSNNLERFKTYLAKLNKLGVDMYNDLVFQTMKKRGTLEEKYTQAAEKVKGSFRGNYQKWYRRVFESMTSSAG
jgi:hypothetical protein